MRQSLEKTIPSSDPSRQLDATERAASFTPEATA